MRSARLAVVLDIGCVLVFVIIGRVFSILPIASSVAVRINILAAICSAVSAGMWFLITERRGSSRSGCGPPGWARGWAR